MSKKRKQFRKTRSDYRKMIGGMSKGMNRNTLKKLRK